MFIAAAAPSFKEKDRDLIAWYKREMTKYPIEIKFNTEVKDVASLGADEVIVATGSTPNRIPVPGIDTGLQAIDFLLGKHPTIVEMQDDLITTPGICLANTSFLRDFFAANKGPVHLETKLAEVHTDGVTVIDKDGKKFKIDADNVILSTGYRSAPVAEKAKNVHIVGDACKVGNLRTVIWQAWDICMKL